MDSPELTQKFVKLASMDNKIMVWYYRNTIMPILMRYYQRVDRIIDIGCGGGILLSLLKQQGFDNLYGIDGAKELLCQVPNTIPTVCADYLNIKLCYEENIFDGATVFNTLHHLDCEGDMQIFFHNLHYVLKPGAIVVIKEICQGVMYKLYRNITKLISSQRRFVWRQEADMHRRFFAVNFYNFLKGIRGYEMVGYHFPFYFEEMFVLEAK